MELVEQICCSCVPTSIFMLNDNKDYRYIKRYCKKHFGYSAARNEGCGAGGDDLVTLLRELGHDAHIVESRFKDIGKATKYNKALIFVNSSIYNSTNDGHCVAWDGYQVYDPTGPELLSEKEFMESYWHYRNVYAIFIKVHPARRLINKIKHSYIKYRKL